MCMSQPTHAASAKESWGWLHPRSMASCAAPRRKGSGTNISDQETCRCDTIVPYLTSSAGTCSFFTWASEGQDQPNVAIALFVSCLALAELARRERHRGVPLSARGALPRVCMQSVGLELGHVANCHVGGQVVVSAGGGFSCQQKIRWASIVLPRTETGRGQRVRKPFHDIILR